MVRVVVQGLLEPALRLLQFALLTQPPAVLDERVGRLRLGGEPVLDHAFGVGGLAGAEQQQRQRMAAAGVVARAAQAELVVFDRLGGLALAVVALADVVHQVGVGRLQLQRHLEALARVLVLAALVKVDAFLAKLLHALVHIRQTPGQRGQDEQGE